MSSKKELLEKLANCVVEMEDEEVVDVAKEYLNEGYLAFDGIMNGLVEGMNEASRLYDEEEYFVTDVLLCSDAMYAGLDVLRPYLPEEGESQKVKGVIGVVRIMFETAGFEMYDLGRDVALKDFVKKVKETKAKLLCMSTLMTTTMGGMETVINMLKEEGIRNEVTVMVGGSPISQKYANDIGADGYSSNAV